VYDTGVDGSLLRKILLCAALWLASGVVFASPVNVYVFYGESCLHCAEEDAFLARLVHDRTDIQLHRYEVYYNQGNAQMFKDFAAACSIEEMGVPTTFIGNHVMIGFTNSVAQEITDAIESQRSAPGMDPMERYTIYKRTGSVLPLDSRAAAPPQTDALGTLALTMGLLDGLNPCAFFILLFLLSVLVRTDNRWRMAFISVLFVLVSGVVYFLFMAAWLNAFAVIASLRWATIAAGLIALAIGAVNLKDGVYSRRGISLGVSEGNRTRLVGQMYKLAARTSLPSIAGATIVLAGMASLYQIVCTVGVPLAFVRILTTRGLTSASHYGYLGLFCLAYIVPLASVAFISSIALSARKMTESLGKVLKLFSGVMMLSLGAVFLFSPGTIASPIRLVLILAGDVMCTVLIALVVRRVRRTPA
jgi:hypothetical protein